MFTLFIHTLRIRIGNFRWFDGRENFLWVCVLLNDNWVDKSKRFVYYTSLVGFIGNDHLVLTAIIDMRKYLSLILAIALILSLFAATGFSRSDCGKVCCCVSKIQGLQHTAKYQAQINGNCCTDAPAHPCGFAKNHNIDLPMCTLSVCRTTAGSSAGTAVILNDPPYANKFIIVKSGSPLAKTYAVSSPIYLQHLSLLI